MTIRPPRNVDLPVDPVPAATSAGKIEHVAGFGELRIDKDLWTALCDLLGDEPLTAGPVVVLAAYLHSLRDSLGLSEHFDRDTSDRSAVAPPPGGTKLISEALGLSADEFTIERLADTLYEVCTTLADDPAALRRLNRRDPITPEGLLTIAQVGWNIEQSDDRRPRLPIRSNQALTDGTTRAHIKTPDRDADYAAMDWTKRTNAGVTGLGAGRASKSSGQGLRKKVATLAALAAEQLIHPRAGIPVDLTGATIVMEGDRRVIRWAMEQHQPSGSSLTALAGPPDRILIGVFEEVGGRYQPRQIDEQLQDVWSGSGDRRVWLRGGPGMGKSYTARHVMEDALRSASNDREALLIWVDSADAASATREFSRAASTLPSISGLGFGPGQVDDSLQARALLRHLATTTDPWLIILDNADPDDLIDGKLIPPGTNIHGRVIITTASASERAASHGICIDVDEFTAEEGDAYVLSRIPESSGKDRASLIKSLGAQPLALSIAASTIAVNRMSIADWLDEFYGSTLDVAADHRDTGGYPTLISGAWRIALERASRGLPAGEVERAALIAALHDPDGHPTWIWQRNEILTWLTDDTVTTALTTRMPRSVQRLIDHSILRFAGRSWKDGSISIHQLAARAIRETVEPVTLEAAVNVIANAWLLRPTEAPMMADHTDIARHARVLHDSAREPQALTRFLLASSSAEESNNSSPVHRAITATLREMYWRYFLEGGLVGKLQLAKIVGGTAENAEELRFARELLTQVVDTDEAPLATLALCHSLLADIDAKLMNPASSREHQALSAALNEQILAAADGEGGSRQLRLASAIALTQYRVASGNHHGAIETALEAAHIVTASSPEHEQKWNVDDRSSVYSGLLRCGLLDDAERFWNASEGEQHLGLIGEADPDDEKRKFARLRALHLAFQKDWSAAEKLLTTIGTEPLLLASVQAHQGESGISRSAETIAESCSPPAQHGRVALETDKDLHRKALDAVSRDVSLHALWEGVRYSLRLGIQIGPIGTALLRLLDESPPSLVRSEEQLRARTLIVLGGESIGLDDSQARNLIESSIATWGMLHALDPEDESVLTEMALAHIVMMDLDLTQEAIKHHFETGARLLSDISVPPTALVYIYLSRFQRQYWFALEGPGRRKVRIRMAEQLVDVARWAEGKADALSLVGLALQNLLRSLHTLEHKKWPKHLRLNYGALAMEYLQEIEKAEHYLLEHDSDVRIVPGIMFLVAQRLAKQDGEERRLAFVQRCRELWERLEAREPTSPFAQYGLSVALFSEARARGGVDSPPDDSVLLETLVNRMDLPARLDPAHYGGFYLVLLEGLSRSLRDASREDEASIIETRAGDYRAEHPDLDDSTP